MIFLFFENIITVLGVSNKRKKITFQNICDLGMTSYIFQSYLVVEGYQALEGSEGDW